VVPRADPVFYNFRNLYPHKKASHLASDGDKTNRDLLFYMLGQSGQLDGHRGEDRKAVHSCEYPGSAQPLAVKLPV